MRAASVCVVLTPPYRAGGTRWSSASDPGYEEIPLFLLSPEAEVEAPSKPQAHTDRARMGPGERQGYGEAFSAEERSRAEASSTRHWHRGLSGVSLGSIRLLNPGEPPARSWCYARLHRTSEGRREKAAR